jgi:hypothetical protein
VIGTLVCESCGKKFARYRVDSGGQRRPAIFCKTCKRRSLTKRDFLEWETDRYFPSMESLNRWRDDAMNAFNSEESGWPYEDED